MSEDKKEFGKWWIFIVLLLAITAIIFTTMSYFGKYTGTVVERKVFKQSYQKQAGDSKRLAAYQAQLSAINTRLRGDLDSQTRSDLESQKSMLEVQIRSAR